MTAAGPASPAQSATATGEDQLPSPFSEDQGASLPADPSTSLSGWSASESPASPSSPAVRQEPHLPATAQQPVSSPVPALEGPLSPSSPRRTERPPPLRSDARLSRPPFTADDRRTLSLSPPPSPPPPDDLAHTFGVILPPEPEGEAPDMAHLREILDSTSFDRLLADAASSHVRHILAKLLPGTPAPVVLPGSPPSPRPPSSPPPSSIEPLPADAALNSPAASSPLPAMPMPELGASSSDSATLLDHAAWGFGLSVDCAQEDEDDSVDARTHVLVAAIASLPGGPPEEAPPAVVSGLPADLALGRLALPAIEFDRSVLLPAIPPAAAAVKVSSAAPSAAPLSGASPDQPISSAVARPGVAGSTLGSQISKFFAPAGPGPLPGTGLISLLSFTPAAGAPDGETSLAPSSPTSASNLLAELSDALRVPPGETQSKSRSTALTAAAACALAGAVLLGPGTFAVLGVGAAAAAAAA
ncbi:hypothetical protein H696_02960, partial [Fonticula alba]